MKKKIIIYYNRIREHLWFKPFLFCIASVVGALVAHQADGTSLNEIVPLIKTSSIEKLLDIISASMLVISIFAVSSMLSAFSAASSTATPRSFNIVVTDDVSQYALSIFIGSFIFSIVATVALNNGYYDKAGKFILFLFTLILFAVVILTFLRWVDRISRLGRLEHTVLQVESVANKSLSVYIENPLLNALPIKGKFTDGISVMSNANGYVQNLNLESLQALAEEMEGKIRLNCLPGKFIHKNFPVAYFSHEQNIDIEEVSRKINNTINIGKSRIFDEDPRFGIIALTEIASRALSPGINDPGTAIQIIGSHERLFFLWNQKKEKSNEESIQYDRIEVPEISINDFFEDAFRPISRDGAGNIEVMLRLQKTFKALSTINHDEIKKTAIQFSENAFKRAEKALKHETDLETLKAHSLFRNKK